jgi:CheY-like chemotaxis protein
MLQAYQLSHPYVFSAYIGRRGVAVTATVNSGLIFPDNQLPVMDGYATARQLRKKPELGGAPVIALTSYATTGDREKTLAAGYTGNIQKPIDPKNFIEQIEQYLPSTTPGGKIR